MRALRWNYRLVRAAHDGQANLWLAQVQTCVAVVAMKRSGPNFRYASDALSKFGQQERLSLVEQLIERLLFQGGHAEPRTASLSSGPNASAERQGHLLSSTAPPADRRGAGSRKPPGQRRSLRLTRCSPKLEAGWTSMCSIHRSSRSPPASDRSCASYRSGSRSHSLVIAGFPYQDHTDGVQFSVRR